MLAFAAASLLIVVALIVAVPFPKPKPIPSKLTVSERAADALETIAETLETISGVPPGTRSLSVTVRLDENQWKNVRETAAGLHKFGEGIADRVGEVADKVDSITGPWGCVSPSCLGTVRFPHNEPDLPDWLLEADVDEKCSQPWDSSELWDDRKIPDPTKSDLEDIIKKLKAHNPSPIWILGHASTLGDKDHNDKLSLRRARFVECYLKNTLNNLPISSKTCAAGDKASTSSLRYPDFRYRLVQILSGQPPEFLCDYELQCKGKRDPVCPPRFSKP